ncbi:hypothetical protein H6F97_00015 [Microcoleus sp. FACHB-1]|nr:hypothetical protein [Microcoleus sp. FACHB-1]
MSVKLCNKLTVATSSSKFNYQPYISEFFTILVGVLITSASIIGSGMLISIISEPSSAPFTPEATNVHVRTYAR